MIAARARPLRAARGVPPLGAARPAAPARGGARLRARGGAGDPARRGGRRSRRRGRARAAPADLDSARRRAARARGRCARRDRRGRADRRATEPLRFAAYAGGDSAGRRRATTPAELVARAPSDRPVVAHDCEVAAATVPRHLDHDTMIAAYLIDPAAPRLPLDELAEDAASASDADGRAGRRGARARRARSPSSSAAQLDEDGLDRPLHRHRAAARRRAREMERAGHQARHAEALRDRRKVERATPTRSSARSTTLAGEEFTIGSPQQLATILFDEARPVAEAPRQDRLLAPTRACSQAIRDEHEIIPKIERWRELTKLKSRPTSTRCPQLIDDDGRLHTTFNQTATTTGRLVEHQPEPAEHPDPHRARPRDPRLLHRRAGQRAHLAPTTRRSSCGSSPTSPASRRCATSSGAARTCTPRPRRRSSAPRPTRSTPACARRPRWSTSGSSTGCRRYGMADRLKIPQEEAQEFIERYLARFPQVTQFIEPTTIGQADRATATCARCSAAAASIPELRARNWQTRQLGERLAVNTVIQGTAADIIKIAMVRSHDALRDAGLQTRLVLQIHDELLFEGPDDEAEQAPRSSRREMAGAVRAGPAAGGRRRASARTGWRRSRWTTRARRRADRRRRRPDRAAGADQLQPRQDDRHAARPRRSRSRSARSCSSVIASSAAAASARSARSATCAWYYLIGGAARRRATSRPCSSPCARSAPAASSPRRSPAS